MDKYYTPDISEFFVGFEYETSYLQDYDTWKKEILEEADAGYFHSIYFGDAVPTEFRVKYLDREDIESLNFVLKSKSIDLWFEREGIYLRDDGYHLNNIKLQYGLHDQRLKITFNYISGEEQIHFEGTIKNKSELIKLLKQLGIG